MFKRIYLILFLTIPNLVYAHSFYCGDTGKKRIVQFNEQGEVIWSLEKVKPSDFSVLDNGNFLYSHVAKGMSYVQEITKDKKVVWEYKEKGEIRSCQRLDDGTTLIGETTKGVLKIIDKESNVLKSIFIKTDNSKGHTKLRVVRKGVDGLYYVAQHGEGLARAYNEAGELVRDIKHQVNVIEKSTKKTRNACYAVNPLKDGTLLLSGLSVLKIIDTSGKTIWELHESDIPEVNIYSFTGTHVLENGNILVTNWLGHGATGKGHHVVEIDRQTKKVVWSMRNDKELKYALFVAQ